MSDENSANPNDFLTPEKIAELLKFTHITPRSVLQVSEPNDLTNLFTPANMPKEQFVENDK